jgi:diguanylate cyclase
MAQRLLAGKAWWRDRLRIPVKTLNFPPIGPLQFPDVVSTDADSMRYTDSGPRSTEILRLVLPSISKHGGSYIPTSYAVWYEHLAGSNIGLTADLTERLRKTPLLDQKVVQELYSRHILPRDGGNTSLLQKGLEALAKRLAQAATDSSGGAEQYARALEAGQAELQSFSGAEELQSVLRKLMDSTQEARKSADALRTELDASQLELRAVRDRLGHLETEVVKDPLTGLLNRRGFDQAVEQLRADGFPLTTASLLMLDLDHFKRINDTYGHPFGDQVLCVTSKVLNGVIKGRDIAARFGGEEFLVLLPDTHESGAVALAEQFRQAFAKARIRRSGSDTEIDQVTVSIGVACPGPDESLEQTIGRADAALYRAKNDGRNCVRTAAAA